MTAETALLCDIIRAVPDGSCWYITPDSWEKIPAILGSLLEVKSGIDTNYEDWLIVLSAETKEVVLRKIVGHELAEKIVHMEIESPEEVVLFRSWDRMYSIDVSSLPDAGLQLRNKYPSLNDYMV